MLFCKSKRHDELLDIILSSSNWSQRVICPAPVFVILHFTVVGLVAMPFNRSEVRDTNLAALHM